MRPGPKSRPIPCDFRSCSDDAFRAVPKNGFLYSLVRPLTVTFPLTFKGVLSPHEAGHFYDYAQLYRFPYGIRARIAFITTALAAVLGLYFRTKGLSAEVAYLAIAVCALGPFVLFWLLRVIANLKYRVLANDFRETEVLLDKDAIQITQDRLTTRLPWERLKVIAHTPYGLMFFVKGLFPPAFVLPNRVFDSADAKYEILAHAIDQSVKVAVSGRGDS